MASVCSMILCANCKDVTIWGHDAGQLEDIAKAGENKYFLPGYKLPSGLRFEPDDEKAFGNCDLILHAVPCQYTRKVWQRLSKYCPANIPVASITKGIENKTLMRPTEIIADILSDDRDYAVLSGPSIADELARELPASVTAASDNMDLAVNIQVTFNTSWFRVYTNSDIIGVELCGALKNVIAIAAGILDGIKAGDNAKAALLARGLAEITRLGTVLGADEHTFPGLSGLGDLVTTCISPTGRNRSFGQRIGQEQSAKDALEATNSVVEGVATCESVIELAKKNNVEMPITQAVYSVIFEEKPVLKAIEELMTRELKSEG
jgi:glycerol-3-phosphate dehydrogenase (NAD(P)+)